jgi:hypothetical protein
MEFTYDPHSDPAAERWLALDEYERIHLVMAYHRAKRVALPNPQLHATIHAVVENQIALGDEIPVAETLRRLINEGLDRHEAIHAIGSVLAQHMYTLLSDGKPDEDPNLRYFEDLKALTADSWRRSE